MNKLSRERRDFIIHQGLEFQRFEHHGKHVAFTCREGILICVCTPSDHRERDQFRAMVRRLGRC